MGQQVACPMGGWVGYQVPCPMELGYPWIQRHGSTRLQPLCFDCFVVSTEDRYERVFKLKTRLGEKALHKHFGY